MKDDRGIYYYPFPQNKRVKMYVQKQGQDILFRMWNADDPVLWMEHGWVPFDAIEQAKAMFGEKKRKFDPGVAYDIDVARALLKDEM